MKILTVVGARPQFIKAAVVSRRFRQFDFIKEEIIHTGQHYDHGMSQVFFDEMEIPSPTVNLHIGSGLHGAATGDMLKGLEHEMIKRRPDYVLVYGDTNSTLAGALAAAKLHIPVAHIEAGERSYNRKMPEEINRVMTDHVSTTLFCCSVTSTHRLAQEGITQNVFHVGDVMFDAFLMYSSKATWPTHIEKMTSHFVLATIHRAQNTDDLARLQSILEALSSVPDPIILPLHPRTLKIIQSNRISIAPNIHLLEPVSYFEMLGLLKECAYVITDSGGLQKESYYAKKKCLILRNETEWTELVTADINRLVQATPDSVLSAITWAKQPLSSFPTFYGDGKAGEKIADYFIKNTKIKSLSQQCEEALL